MRSKNEVLCAAAGRLAAERSEVLQTFITNYLRHVKKPGRNFK
jgi:hypothetical protein